MIPVVELPPSMRELVELVGLDAAMKLVDWRGGVGFHAPKEVPDDHELVKTVGHIAARKLAQQFGGDWVHLPRCHALLLAERNRRIIADRKPDFGVRRLALKYKLTERQVWNIVGKAADRGQGELF